ncbi:MAG: serine/threonine-protein kinase, partial [Chloroflexota bacterium]
MLTPSTVLGARLGDYEIQDVLGSGGMATVYRGFDHTLQRPVAIKVLSEAAAAQPGLVERFRQEARLIARLRHPHIVQVYAFGQVDQVVYMVQELLPGPTLATRLQELAAQGQPMPRQEILAVIGQLAAALDAAHAAGIIHRDVKPSNAMWNAAGELALTDFGIAKTGA